MSSKKEGKAEVKQYIIENFKKGSTCLDVGACDGIWHSLLGDHLIMDAVEVFEPNIEVHRLREKYRRVYSSDIRGLRYPHYDIIIFGDIIEHIEVEEAQDVLEFAKMRADEVIVAVPFLYPQAAIYGNQYERHIQDDLTNRIFLERYPGFEPMILFPNYGYYRLSKT